MTDQSPVAKGNPPTLPPDAQTVTSVTHYTDRPLPFVHPARGRKVLRFRSGRLRNDRG